MSATGRGSIRIQNDAYYTPPDLAEKLVGLLPIQPYEAVLEPHGGGGSFIQALLEVCPNIVTCDIDPMTVIYLRRTFGVTTHERDFLNYTDSGFDWIIGNPPYQDAMEHILHSFNLLRSTGNLCFLLRLAFLESKKRIEFWKEHPVHKIWVLSERPSFTGGSTDSCAYGFFWWKKETIGPSEIEVLSWR
jgi:hypothetical protein